MLHRTSWNLTGSSSSGISLLVISGGIGTFNLERNGMQYQIDYSMAGAGISPIPASLSHGPSWMPQAGTPIWSITNKELQFQDLIGPITMMSGALTPGIPGMGGAAGAIWFNAPLAVGLAFRAAALMGGSRLAGALEWLNRSAGGVAFLAGPEFSTPDVSASLVTGLSWPHH